MDKKELNKKINEILENAKVKYGKEAEPFLLKKRTNLRLSAEEAKCSYMNKRKFWSFCNKSMSLFLNIARELALIHADNPDIHGVKMPPFTITDKKKGRKLELELKRKYKNFVLENGKNNKNI